MTVSKIYSSTDTGAPILQEKSGALTSLLKAVLVDGYGSKTALGWTLEFEGGTNDAIKVFRNKGTGQFLRVEDSDTFFATASRASARICTYYAMQDHDIGYAKCPSSGYHYFVWGWSKVVATSRPWRIIGDDKGFWLISNLHSDRRISIAYFGDYTPYHLNNVSNWISIATTVINTAGNNYYYLRAPSAAPANEYSKIIKSHLNEFPCMNVSLTACTEGSPANQIGYRTVTVELPFHSIYGVRLMVDGYKIIGELPGVYGIGTACDVGDIIQGPNGSQIHVECGYSDTESYRMGFHVGEGFRP